MPIDRELYPYTPAQVGQVFGVSADTIRRWARQGRIDAIALPGGRWIIHKDVVNKPTPK